MREFTTGASRNSLEGKLSYMRALSPAVLQRYVKYLAGHRKQADGKLRDFDNWKKGIPLSVYVDSLLRHTLDLWLNAFGENTSEGAETQDLLCAIIFNAQGLLYEIMVDRGEAEREAGETLPGFQVVQAPKQSTCRDCAQILNPGCVCFQPQYQKPVYLDAVADPQCFVPKAVKL